MGFAHPAKMASRALGRLLLAGILAGAAPADGPLDPDASFRALKVADDLAVDAVLAEPDVRQPVSLTFDERGRMWVVQYLQYPVPAGLTILSRDQFWRVVYDKVPAAPPNHTRGADRITIHEDTDGDGRYDRQSTFVDGLNIATAVALGRGGAFVLNPPYLLFYPKAGGADRPTGDPEVLLEGFGLEDSHAVVNSLRWGPDGWLYGAQGSTVTANVRRPGTPDPPIRSVGQLIWRYHPETRRYEVFAEGGGNAFGVEFDARGRVYSGHNGGNTRGFHYVPGGYYRKGFEKHGPLSNPYAFGFFEAMKHNNAARFSHTFTLVDDGALPARYRGHLIAVDPLAGKLIEADVAPDGSTWKTQDVGPILQSADPWFRPVDVKFGPDGALYVADWYDGQVNHYRNHEGKMDHETGRIYRVRARDARPVPAVNLGIKPTGDLIELLKTGDKWARQTALRLLGDRRDASTVPTLRGLLDRGVGQPALEALWALNLSGGFDEAAALRALAHREAAVREWAVRLLGDARRFSGPVAGRVAELAEHEADVEVLVQVAASARRLPPHQAMTLARALLGRDDHAGDPHFPLMVWWLIESQCSSAPGAVGDLFDLPTSWVGPLAREVVVPRLMRRFATAGSPGDLRACVRLFLHAPDPAARRRLLEGFEAAFSGRSIAGLPVELLEEVARAGGGSLALGVRLGRPDALVQARAVVLDPKASLKDRIECVEAFGEVAQPSSIPALLALATGPLGPDELRARALTALRRYDSAEVGSTVLNAFPVLPATVQPAALELLASRKVWALPLARAVGAGQVDRATVPLDVVRRLATLPDPATGATVRQVWGDVRGATTAEMAAEIDRVSALLQASGGDPAAGKRLFGARCASCHKMFGLGGEVGPDLTAYQRHDLPTMLLSIVNPGAEIREGFENRIVETTDGRTLMGIPLEQNPKTLVLRTPDGQRVAIDRAEVDREAATGQSIMPEGQLAGLTDGEIRNLFGYLRSTQPILP